jgi:hypothetical protein
MRVQVLQLPPTLLVEHLGDQSVHGGKERFSMPLDQPGHRTLNCPIVLLLVHRCVGLQEAALLVFPPTAAGAGIVSPWFVDHRD